MGGLGSVEPLEIAFLAIGSVSPPAEKEDVMTHQRPTSRFGGTLFLLITIAWSRDAVPAFVPMSMM